VNGGGAITCDGAPLALPASRATAEHSEAAITRRTPFFREILCTTPAEG
jgi:hypothetical protein